MVVHPRESWPRLRRWAFVGASAAMIFFYGLVDLEEVATTEGFEIIDGREYVDLLQREKDDTILIDVRSEHEQTDRFANAFASGKPDDELIDYMTTHREELKGKNLVVL